MSESFLKIHKKIIKKLLEIDIGMKFSSIPNLKSKISFILQKLKRQILREHIVLFTHFFYILLSNKLLHLRFGENVVYA